MSPRKFTAEGPTSVEAATRRLWVGFGQELREARTTRRWTIAELAERAGLSPGMVHRVESGLSASTETAVRLATAVGLRLEFELIDPRRRADPRTSLSADPVHSAMGELEAGHLRALTFPVGIDEPYQHFQFAGRADVTAWDLERVALLHIENRTRFPDFQDMAGSFNAKRAYLAESIGARLGIQHWASQTHVIAALWSAEVLHALRLREQSFRSICPDDDSAFDAWWRGDPPATGVTSTLVVLDPLASGRQRLFIGLEDAVIVRPRHRGYADAVSRLMTRPRRD